MTAWCLSGAEREPGQPLRLLNVPSREQRAVLQKRHKELTTHMAQRDNSIIADAVTALLGCYRNALKPGEDIRPVAAKYVKELHGLPTWACVRACDAIRLHQYADCITFVPSTIRLREIAASYCATIVREATEIFDVLRGERLDVQVSAEERQRIALGFKKLSQELQGADPAKPERFRPYSDDDLRRMYPAPSPQQAAE